MGNVYLLTLNSSWIPTSTSSSPFPYIVFLTFVQTFQVRHCDVNQHVVIKLFLLNVHIRATHIIEMINIRDTCNSCGRQIKNFSPFFFRFLPSASIFNEMQIRNRTTSPYHELSLTDDPARWKNRSRAKMGDPRVDRRRFRSQKVHGTFAVPEEEIHVSVGRQLA